LKRRGWCGRLYSLPIVTSSPLTLVQWQETATGTHTLATTLWWLAWKYRSKSFYLYSLYFFQIVFMSTNTPKLSELHFFILISNWYENDIKNLVSYHSHQTLIKISFTSNPYQNILTSLWSGIFWSDFEMWSENVDFFESNSYQIFWSDFNNQSDQQHFKCLVGIFPKCAAGERRYGPALLLRSAAFTTVDKHSEYKTVRHIS
jgi:hypothetical protein